MFMINIYFLILIFLLKILGQDIDDVKYIKNDKALYDPEKNAGAHYYAYSPYSTGYSKITSYIQLPSSLNNGNRNAYIAFGVYGLNGGIDIGIRNTGTLWHPFYYDVQKKNFKSFNSDNDLAPSETKIIGIEVEVTSDKNILFSLSYRTSDLNILKSFNTKIEAKHIFEEGVVKNRFYRFASLVPIGEDDQEDGTYMLDGKFTGLAIVKNNNVQSWGISGDDIEYAWIVSSSKIEFSYQDGNDNFSINHKKKEIENFSLNNTNENISGFGYPKKFIFSNSINILILIIMTWWMYILY